MTIYSQIVPRSISDHILLLLDETFKQSRYLRFYKDVIGKALSENRKKLRKDNPDYQYFEKHHILPRAIFPEYEAASDNLALLTAREHLLVHYFLHRCATEQHRDIMLKAIVMMSGAGKKRYKPTYLFKRVREQYASYRSRQPSNMKGRHFSESHSQNMSKSLKKFHAEIGLTEEQKTSRKQRAKLIVKIPGVVEKRVATYKDNLSTGKTKISPKVLEGHPQTDLSKKKIGEKNSLDFKAITPTGEEILFSNLREFCRKMGMSREMIQHYGFGVTIPPSIRKGSPPQRQALTGWTFYHLF